MRTTIDIHDPLLDRAKKMAKEKSVRLADVVNDALTVLFDASRKTEEVVEPYKIITFKGTGPAPGVDIHSNASIQEAMDEGYRLPDGSYDLTRMK